MVPTALRSVAANTTVECKPAASKAWATTMPPFSIFGARNNSSGSGCRPWSSRVER